MSLLCSAELQVPPTLAQTLLHFDPDSPSTQLDPIRSIEKIVSWFNFQRSKIQNYTFNPLWCYHKLPGRPVEVIPLIVVVGACVVVLAFAVAVVVVIVVVGAAVVHGTS